MSKNQQCNLDAHNTPPEVARALVANAKQLNPAIVADFASGRGNLLLEAETSWTTFKVIATDVDSDAVKYLKRLRPKWVVGKCDFLSAKSRSASPILREHIGKISVVLLNPPFTCRGGKKISAYTPTGRLQCSLAVAFIINSLPYLSSDGQINAILPAGTMSNEKDHDAWDYLKKEFKVIITGIWGKNTFQGCAATTVMVHLDRKKKSEYVDGLRSKSQPVLKIEKKNAEQIPGISVRLLRGGFQMHRLRELDEGPTLIHSTDLVKGQILLNGRRGRGSTRLAKSPSVLLPRVGNMTIGKIAILNTKRDVMLSDCVFALECGSFDDANTVKELLASNFATLNKLYQGTGARFITIGRLAAFLMQFGMQVKR